MNAQLVKIDVAADLLQKSIPEIVDMVDGGTLLLRGLAWVFNVARNPQSRDRELRFWRPELLTRVNGGRSRFNNWELDWVIDRILPVKKLTIHAGELDQMFQLRPRTRIDFGEELNGAMKGGRNFYSREVLAQFLRRRWLGAIILPARPDQAVNGLGRAVPAAEKVRLVNPASTSSVAASGGNVHPGQLFSPPKAAPPHAAPSARPTQTVSRVGNSARTAAKPFK